MIDIDKEFLTVGGVGGEPEIFATLEGEGRYVGQPSIFIRMATCNLTCSAWASPDSPNGCDSYVSWSVKNKITFRKAFEILEGLNAIQRLKDGWILKLTGGEPFIRQKELYKFVQALGQEYGINKPKIDFETNGTIMPDCKMWGWDDSNSFSNLWIDNNVTFTTSPKLSTNGDPEEKTYKPEVLRFLKKNYACFKFVITGERDIEEIWRKYVEDKEGINITRDMIWFMPCCGSRQEHIERATTVAEYAKSMGVNFSPRLHLILWDKSLRV
jgi:organic radical activating enzyme